MRGIDYLGRSLNIVKPTIGPSDLHTPRKNNKEMNDMILQLEESRKKLILKLDFSYESVINYIRESGKIHAFNSAGRCVTCRAVK